MAQSATLELQKLRIEDGRYCEMEDGRHYEIEDDTCLPFRHIKNLGSGRSGIVEEVLHTETNAVYARKTFEVKPGEWKNVNEIFKREVEITRRLARHRHIVRLVASYSTAQAPTVILQPAADGGTLKAFVDRFAKIDDGIIKASMRDTLRRAYGCLANGLAFIHQNEIRHRDIKPENILFHAGSVLYTDFGISRDYSDRTRATTEGKPDLYTPRYCAPEVWFWERRTWKSDVFSLGCVFLIIYTATWPNERVEDIATNAWYHERTDELQDIMTGFVHDTEVVECMKGMLREEEGQRPSAAEVEYMLKERGDRYFCEQCAAELPRNGIYTDGMMSVSRSSSTTVCEDNMSRHSGSTKFDLVGEGDVTQHLRSGQLVHASTTFDFRAQYAEFLKEATARYSQAHVHYNGKTIVYGRNGTRQHASAMYISPNNALTNTQSAHANAGLLYKDSMIPTPSKLSRYGFRSHKVVRTLQHSGTTGVASDQADAVVHEEHISEWKSRYLGLGLRMRRGTPYGSIIPALSTYPIVADFDDFTWDLLQNGTVLNVQKAFTAHKLHPSVQTAYGEDLYHIALLARRLDICHLLHAHNVHPSTTTPTSHLKQLIQASTYLSTAEATPLLSFVLTTLTTDPDTTTALWPSLSHTTTLPLPTLLYLWHHLAGPHALDPLPLAEFCTRQSLRHLATTPSPTRPTILTHLQKFLTPDLISRIRDNKLAFFLSDLFAPIDTLSDPDPFHIDTLAQMASELGRMWLALLAGRGVDVAKYLEHEVKAHPGGCLVDYAPEGFEVDDADEGLRRVIMCEFDKVEGYGVWFRCVEEDELVVGELVTEEFEEMIWRTEVEEWPFGGGERKKIEGIEGAMPGTWVE